MLAEIANSKYWEKDPSLSVFLQAQNSHYGHRILVKEFPVPCRRSK